MKTISEKTFESFLAENGLRFDAIGTADSPRPDYLVYVGDSGLIFEVKELKELDDVPASRKLGQHIRRKIGSAKKQIQFGANQGLPSISLLYNSFGDGIEDIDFMTAMYGELTVDVKKSTLKMAGEPYHGRNNKLSKTDNTSFSAVGRLSLNHRAKSQSDKLAITLFENAFSKVKVPWEHLPSCFDVRRVEIT